jgi:hypothetical protein
MSDLCRRALVTISILMALGCCSCQRGKPFYPVHGKVLVDGKPAEGVTIVFHPLENTEPPLLPSAIVAADGSFTLQSWLVEKRELKQGAPAGEYHVTCVWYPPDLEKYLANATLPDKLHGKYSDKNKSELRAEVAEAPTELPPFELDGSKK